VNEIIKKSETRNQVLFKKKQSFRKTWLIFQLFQVSAVSMKTLPCDNISRASLVERIKSADENMLLFVENILHLANITSEIHGIILKN
jgi:hypothetical protein